MAEYVGIIEARLGSSRLPRKVLLKNNERTMLEIMVSRVKEVKRIKEIVIATTSEPEDEEICELAKKLGVKYFRGSTYNVYDRVLSAVRASGYSRLVSLQGDCPLIDPAIISQCIEKHIETDVEYLCNFGARQLPDGMECQVMRLKCLERLQNYELTSIDKEHVTLFILNNPELFSINFTNASSELVYPNLKLTLDEPEDFILISKILDYFYPRISFSLLEIIEFLLTHLPESVSRELNTKK